MQMRQLYACVKVANDPPFGKTNHSVLDISLPSVHDYNVKMLNFTFCGGHKHKTTAFSFSS